MTPPCGVPLSRPMRLPSAICIGAFSHLPMYKSAHGQSVCLRTARIPPHRWRKVAAGRQTIPKFIEVVFKISLKIRNHLAVYASRPLVGSDPLIGFPHLPFRNVIRLGSIHEGPPVASCPLARAEQRNPFAPAPLQDLHHYYGLLRPCAPHRYSHPYRVHLFGFLP